MNEPNSVRLCTYIIFHIKAQTCNCIDKEWSCSFHCRGALIIVMQLVTRTSVCSAKWQQQGERILKKKRMYRTLCQFMLPHVWSGTSKTSDFNSVRVRSRLTRLCYLWLWGLAQPGHRWALADVGFPLQLATDLESPLEAPVWPERTHRHTVWCTEGGEQCEVCTVQLSLRCESQTNFSMCHSIMTAKRHLKAST